MSQKFKRETSSLWNNTRFSCFNSCPDFPYLGGLPVNNTKRTICSWLLRHFLGRLPKSSYHHRSRYSLKLWLDQGPLPDSAQLILRTFTHSLHSHDSNRTPVLSSYCPAHLWFCLPCSYPLQYLTILLFLWDSYHPLLLDAEWVLFWLHETRRLVRINISLCLPDCL